MKKLPYSLFPVEIEKLEFEHLKILENTPEGWWVEYKSLYTERGSFAKNIAKSICSFANTYGGWLFYGLAEKKEKSNCQAGACLSPKLNSDQVKKSISAIDSTVRTNIHPVPFFECKPLYSPDNKAVIAIFIPEGHDAPYLHTSGKVYMRVNEQSNPIEVSDRTIIEMLFRKSRTHHQNLSDFLMRRFNEFANDTQRSYIHLYFISDPLNSKGHHSKIDINSFKDHMQKGFSNKDGWGSREIPFKIDSIFPTAGGFIARHLMIDNPANLSFTWRYYENCSSIISIPVPTFSMSQDIKKFLNGYDNKNFFLKYFKGIAESSCRIIDISWIHWILTNVIKKYRDLLLASGLDGSFFAKARIENIYRCIPFIDCRRYKPYITEFGPPIIQDNEVITPVGFSLESLVFIPSLDNVFPGRNDLDKEILIGLSFFEQVCEALAVPKFVIPNGGGTIFGLIQRAQKVNKMRMSSM